jgi:hypothetical protein
MAFTVKELLDYSLDQAQMDKNLSEHYTLAQKIYNLVLQSQADNFDFPWYSKMSANTAFLASTTAYDLPDDYAKSDNCYRVDMSTGNKGSSIWIIPPWEFDKYSASGSSEPSCAWIDQNNSQIVFNSSMTNPGTKGFVIRYFRKPTEITPGSNVNDNDTPDFPDQKTLAELIMLELMKYMNDERYTLQKSIADEEMRGTKLNAYDYDDNSNMSLGKSFKPGRRPSRGGGYGFGF